MKSALLLGLCWVLFAANHHLCAQTHNGQAVSVIAFGSCARERKKQPVWEDIIAKEPDLFLMIGDNHYADFWMEDGKMVMKPVPNVNRIREAYDALGQKEGYIKLKQHCKLMATWDDHDYGANDMGNDFRLRKESQQEFIRFFGFDAQHPIHQQQGIYHSQIFGNVGQRIQVIMLDTRFHRDKLTRRKQRVDGKGPYNGSTDASTTILGSEQWNWLQRQLRMPAEIRIIASSIQVVADEHGWETWGNFPHERQRLYQMIHQTNASGVIVISGDRHLMEISCDDSRTQSYPIWDFTSSGLTQDSQSVDEPNQYRVGPVKREQNFGLIRVDWATKPASTRIHFEGFGAAGKPIVRQTVLLRDLQIN